MIISDQEVDEQETDEGLRNNPPAQKGVTLTKNYSMIYWREGILVIYEMGKFLIESFTDHVRMIYLLLFLLSFVTQEPICKWFMVYFSIFCCYSRDFTLLKTLTDQFGIQ